MYKSYSLNNLNKNKNKKKKLKLILEKKNEEIHIIKDDEIWCLNCRKMTNHGLKNCPNKQIVCMNCNHRGHYKYDCYIYKNACYRCLTYGTIKYQDECELHRNVQVCGCIIRNEDKSQVLLIKGNMSKCWGFPKGASENNETLQKCAERETYEETGIKVLINEKSRKEVINGITYFYITLPNSKTVSYDDVIDKNEVCEIKWINIYDLVQNTSLSTNKSVKLFINNLCSE